MTVVFWAAYVMLGAGALLTLVRLARGPSLLDRVVATDVLLVIISAAWRSMRRSSGTRPSSRCWSWCRCWPSSGRCRCPRYIGGMILGSSSPDGPAEEER